MSKFQKNSILHNRFVLYFIFIVALADFLYLVQTNDIYSASIFALIGFLTSFFNKNMIVILTLAITVANIMKYGNSITRKEGLTSKKDGGQSDSEDTDSKDTDSKDTDSKETDSKDTDSKETDSKDTDSKETDSAKIENEESVAKKTKKPAKSSFSVETTEDSNKELFEPVVYTSDKEKSVSNSEKGMSFPQEHILERMNKYKPLLDTLNGLTKNIAIVKGYSNTEPEKE